jgi:phosphatidylserine/phosphatidylglycerophosphate/cardiolipin synthase-like enzyme
MLRRNDPHGRFQAFYRAVSAGDGRECTVNVHSKAVMIDDVFLRVGSSNLNRRSLGLDTECDLAIEARSAAHREAVAAVRNGLIAEHLGATPQEVEAAYARDGSMLAAVRSITGRTSSLRPLPRRPISAALGLLTAIADPAGPFDPIGFLLGRRKSWRSAVR